MNYKFWRDADGSSPVEKDILDLSDKDPESAAKLIRRLESLENYSFNQLRSSRTVEHVRKKIWTLRYELKDKLCRIYFKVDSSKVMQLVHLIIKKDWKLKKRDIELAEKRSANIT